MKILNRHCPEFVVLTPFCYEWISGIESNNNYADFGNNSITQLENIFFGSPITSFKGVQV
jgi:hypothetical protein